MKNIRKQRVFNTTLVLLAILSLALSSIYLSQTKVVTRYAYFLLSTSFVLYFLALLSFIYYRITKETTYFFYIAYLLGSIIYFTIVSGAIHKNLHTAYFNSLEIDRFSWCARIFTYYFYTYFAIAFLRIKKIDTLTYKVMNAVGKIYLGLAILSLLVGLSGLSDNFIDKVNGTISVLCMPVGLAGIVTIGFRIRNKITTILIVGTLSFYIGSVLTFMFSSGMMKYPSNTFPFNYLPFYNDVGTLIESLMFFGSFTYRSKIFLENEAKEKLRLANLRGDIAKDLHDEIGSTLTSINILSTVSEQLIAEQPDRVAEMLHQISGQSKAIQQSMSDIVWSLRNENEMIESLAARMREYAGQTLEPLQISTTLKVAPVLEEERLPMNYRKEILLLFKEATNNIAKHANATIVSIILNKTLKNIELTITDNGEWKGTGTGTGIKSMQERAFSLGGTLAITNSVAGTELKLTVPIP